ncbi:MAG: hypothetical protein H0U49_10875 [Parachlamydiaceae bacterium]|nr:hypothetical protein [Parachlamydiaceae bacterium]
MRREEERMAGWAIKLGHVQILTSLREEVSSKCLFTLTLLINARIDF